MTKKNIQPRKKVSKRTSSPVLEIDTSENTLFAGISYITVIGWIIVYFSSSQAGNEFIRFHIRQAFGVHMAVLLFEILHDFSMIPSILMPLIWLLYLIIIITMMIQAWRGKKAQLAFVGTRFQQWFSFL